MPERSLLVCRISYGSARIQVSFEKWFSREVNPGTYDEHAGGYVDQHKKYSLMDTLTVAERSERMARIRSKNTKPELRVRRLVHKLGYRFRLHHKRLPGRPDLVFPSRRKVVFVHGCFWHAHEGCKVANLPKSRSEYWAAKFERNRSRDAENQKLLEEAGWRVLTIWECEIKSGAMLAVRLSRFLGPAKMNAGEKGAANGRS